VYLTTEFPEWQQKVLVFMDGLFDDATKQLPADFMKQLKGLIGQNDSMKKLTKNVMQFAAFVKAEAELRGREALELRYENCCFLYIFMTGESCTDGTLVML